ncbi:hypothetical protein ANN_08424 [Periplaneta americana]|uniref:BTB domain-containing protein n=1 Tax=Periplaneta americana TaxID=6978 RepID=A0ABQ8T2Y3_PERAM|nr:hypothetical protein ANN_08424 [Periplaneta americana]
MSCPSQTSGFNVPNYVRLKMNVILDDTEHDSNLIKSVASFFEKEDYLDVMFICKGGKKVKAHKLVLSAVSPFLKALFSEWNENQEIVLMVPDIDHNILKLVFVFMYEGTMKLSPSEFVEFKAILKMLKIKFPGAIVDERPVQAPPNRLPPLLKLNPLNKIHLERQTNVAGKKGGDTSVVNDSSSSEVNQPFSTMQDSLIPDRRPKDPDADPLDVPDFYFVPTSTAGAATSASITHATDALNSSGLLMNQEKEKGGSVRLSIVMQKKPTMDGDAMCFALMPCFELVQ